MTRSQLIAKYQSYRKMYPDAVEFLGKEREGQKWCVSIRCAIGQEAVKILVPGQDVYRKLSIMELVDDAIHYDLDKEDDWTVPGWISRAYPAAFNY